MSNAQLILLRGLPGSGKSTFAKLLTSEFRSDIVHYEADQYFMNSGVYKYEPGKLAAAHDWCLNVTINMLEHGVSVIVSNTFTRMWEMQPYLDAARRLNVKVTVLHVEGDHGNIHNVPEQQVTRMRDRWEKYQ